VTGAGWPGASTASRPRPPGAPRLQPFRGARGGHHAAHAPARAVRRGPSVRVPPRHGRARRARTRRGRPTVPAAGRPRQPRDTTADAGGRARRPASAALHHRSRPPPRCGRRRASPHRGDAARRRHGGQRGRCVRRIRGYGPPHRPGGRGRLAAPPRAHIVGGAGGLRDARALAARCEGGARPPAAARRAVTVDARVGGARLPGGRGPPHDPRPTSTSATRRAPSSPAATWSTSCGDSCSSTREASTSRTPTRSRATSTATPACAAPTGPTSSSRSDTSRCPRTWSGPSTESWWRAATTVHLRCSARAGTSSSVGRGAAPAPGRWIRNRIRTFEVANPPPRSRRLRIHRPGRGRGGVPDWPAC
jgi:hypothetical protein